MNPIANYDEVLRTARSLDEQDRVRLVEELLGLHLGDGRLWMVAVESKFSRGNILTTLSAGLTATC